MVRSIGSLGDTMELNLLKDANLTTLTQNNRKLLTIVKLFEATKFSTKHLDLQKDIKIMNDFLDLCSDLLPQNEFNTLRKQIEANLNSKTTTRESIRFIENTKDTYYQILIEHLKKESVSKKQLGAFYTPEDVVNTLIKTVIKKSKVKESDLKNKKILDPTMGGGDWISAWFENLVNLSKSKYLTCDELIQLFSNCINGVDIDPVAVLTTRLIFWHRFEFKSSAKKNLKNNLILGNTLNVFSNNNAKKGVFDFILGNPPYVVQNLKSLNCKTKNTNNVYAAITEASTELLKKDGFICFVVPLSLNCSRSTSDLRSYIHESYSTVEYSTYGIRPQKIFENVDQRISVLIAKKKNNVSEQTKYLSYNGHYLWNKRTELIQALAHDGAGCSIKTSDIVKTGWPKVGQNTEVNLLSKINSKQNDQTFYDLLSKQETKFPVYYFGNARYFIKALDYVPYYKNKVDNSKENSELKVVYAKDGFSQSLIISLMNSTLFFWAWNVFSDCFHVDIKILKQFTVKSSNQKIVSTIADIMISSLRANAIKKSHGDNIITEFDVKKSSKEISSIDNFFATYFTLNSQESKFIDNYFSQARKRKCNDNVENLVAA